MKLLVSLALAGLAISAYGQCPSLRKKVNPTDSVTTIFTPLDGTAVALKTFNKADARFSLNLTAPAAENGGQKGVAILLDNGIRLELPDESITVTADTRAPQGNQARQVAKAQVSLADEQIKQLSEHRIVSYRLATNEWTLGEPSGKELQQNITCLLTAQPSQIKE